MLKASRVADFVINQSVYMLPCFSGKLPITCDDDDDAQQVFTITASALELNKPEEDKPTFNNCQDQDELAPPLPPKPLAS